MITDETIAALRADMTGELIYVGDSNNLFVVLDAMPGRRHDDEHGAKALSRTTKAPNVTA